MNRVRRRWVDAWWIALCVLSVACAGAPRNVARTKLSTVRTSSSHSIRFCFDGIPHQKSALPFVLGGTCVHSPTDEILRAYHADGLLLDYNLDRLKQLYKDAGIHTIDDHRDCNNYCPWGPHVVKGGRCMVPPTPGTKNYEEVLFGIGAVPYVRKVSQIENHQMLAAWGALDVSKPLLFLAKE